MRKIAFYIINLFVIGSLWSCQGDEPTTTSIFDEEEEVAETEFDQWLLHNYTYPYNIAFKYRMEDIESSMDYTLAPAEIDKAKKLAKIIKHLWIETYDEIAGVNFTRAYIPKVIHLVGSAAYEDNGMIVGTAEGGTKVTLYYVNQLQINTAFLNKYYFLTMHHEFAHILHQKKNYPVDYDKISAGNYTPTGWQNRKLAEVAPLGFVTPYAGSKPSEDIAEVTACFLTYPEAQWENVMTLAGEKGKPIIDQKLAMVKKYMKDSWQVDLDLLRKVIARRTNEISELDLDHIY